MRLVRLTPCTRTVFLNVLDLISNMPKYAVAKGRKPGIYDTWDECKNQVSGFCDAKYKKFDTHQEAEDFLNSHRVVLVASPGKLKSYAPERTTQIIPKAYESSSHSVTRIENVMAPHMNPVPKISPSDNKFNALYQTVNIVEERLNRFVNEINDKWSKIEKRLTAIEKQVFPSSDLQESEHKRISKRSLSEDEAGSSQKVMKTETTESISGSTRTEVNRFCDRGQKKNYNNFILTDDEYVVVYTDGACSNNGKYGAKAGIGVWFNTDHELNVAEPVRGYATNNNAEIQAATKAITLAYVAGVKKLDIHTDSQFMIKCITSWINKWKRNNWVLSTGGPVKNKDELIVLDNAIKKMEVVRWTHVRGHSGNLGNNKADELARLGAERYQTNITYGQIND